MTVYLLTINHCEGHCDSTVHETVESAQRSLAKFCREWWEWDNLEKAPKSDDGTIYAYFKSKGGDETYSIEKVEVLR